MKLCIQLIAKVLRLKRFYGKENPPSKMSLSLQIKNLEK